MKEKPNKNKLKQLILYVTNKSKKDKHFNFVKLVNLLFVAEMLHFGKHLKSITGYPYIKKSYGSEPKGIRKILKEMVKEGSIKFVPAK